MAEWKCSALLTVLLLLKSMNRFRDTILKLLLDGARELGNIVCSHIRALLNELHTLRRRPEASTSTASAQPVQSGTSSEEVEADGVDRSKGFLMVNSALKWKKTRT